MNPEALRSLVRDVQFDIHGVPAVVTPSGGAATGTRVVWLSPITDQVPTGDLQRSEPRRIMAIRRDDVPDLPRGSSVAVTEPLQTTPDEWLVDAIDQVLPGHWRAIVVPVEGS